ncbi:MAG TPA: hypothetical protein VH120_06820, partial [Gemmataceae bacterium]|nr:hypothetical protein [Gemmataceae bacterium]
SHNSAGGRPIDAVEVGQPLDLPLSSTDPGILVWAERNGRLLVSRDYKMPRHLRGHLAGGRHSPGVLLVVGRSNLPDVIAALELIAHHGDPTDYSDRFHFIP